ncbi:MAG TPA: branched-chain amino acid transaminase [Nitrososphaerales archaeon]|nr:branched-chain amino acid transaminase [Nitrososphaerales archaeon]
MPLKPTQKIWFDGQMVSWDEAKVHVLTHALHYGYAIFEGIRANSTPKGPAIFRLKEHIKRLAAGAKVYRMQLPYTEEQLMEACLNVVKENGLKDCYVRPIVFSSYGEMGVNPLKNKITGAVAAWEWGSYLGEEGMDKGIRCTISSWSRIDPRTLPPHSKCSANYANSILAKMDAISAGFDEAILLTTDGLVAEGSGENIFRVKDGVLTTPSKAAGVLEGITRDSIIQIAKDNGIPFKEDDFLREDTFTADELFLCGTAANVTPIREVDNRMIGNGKYPLTRKIQHTYLDAIHGKIPKYEAWLSYASAPTIYTTAEKV